MIQGHRCPPSHHYSFAQHLGLEIKGLKRFLSVEGKGAGNVPYFGYIKLNMQIPDVAMFNEDCLMLVIEDSHYGRQVPIQMCTLHIDHIPVLMILEELARLLKNSYDLWNSTLVVVED